MDASIKYREIPEALGSGVVLFSWKTKNQGMPPLISSFFQREAIFLSTFLKPCQLFPSKIVKGRFGKCNWLLIWKSILKTLQVNTFKGRVPAESSNYCRPLHSLSSQAVTPAVDGSAYVLCWQWIGRETPLNDLLTMNIPFLKSTQTPVKYLPAVTAPSLFFL